jgi:hypothetical protein
MRHPVRAGFPALREAATRECEWPGSRRFAGKAGYGQAWILVVRSSRGLGPDAYAASSFMRAVVLAARFAPEFCLEMPPSFKRGRRECRVKASPMARVQQKSTRQNHRLSRSSGIPCAMVLRFIRDLPGDRLSCPRRQRIRPRRLGISTGMPEPRDFIVAPDRSSARETPRCDPTRPPHPAPDVHDDREAPPQWDGMCGSKHNFG